MDDVARQESGSERGHSAAAAGARADRSASGFDRLVAESPATRAARALTLKAAACDVTVLLEGESGVGKEVFARALHAASPRAAGPFVPVNCGALPEHLVESLLFGHERGAFTGAAMRQRGRFEEADGGTLFLDELAELPALAQVSLLRALQEGEIDVIGAARPRKVDVRLVAATNRDLRKETAEGRFRQDLFYRVSAFPIRIPPLRERREDIAPLTRRILGQRAVAAGLPPQRIDDAAFAELERRDWPGNVRELENVLARAMILAEGGRIGFEHLSATCDAPCAPSEPAGGPDDRRTLAQVEAEHISRVFAQCRGQVSETARRLGIGRSTLYRKLADLGLDAGR